MSRQGVFGVTMDTQVVSRDLCSWFFNLWLLVYWKSIIRKDLSENIIVCMALKSVTAITKTLFNSSIVNYCTIARAERRTRLLTYGQVCPTWYMSLRVFEVQKTYLHYINTLSLIYIFFLFKVDQEECWESFILTHHKEDFLFLKYICKSSPCPSTIVLHIWLNFHKFSSTLQDYIYIFTHWPHFIHYFLFNWATFG